MVCESERACTTNQVLESFVGERIELAWLDVVVCNVGIEHGGDPLEVVEVCRYDAGGGGAPLGLHGRKMRKRWGE